MCTKWYEVTQSRFNMICGLNATSLHPTKITKWTHIIIIPLVGPPKPRTKSKNSPTHPGTEKREAKVVILGDFRGGLKKNPLWRFWVILATAKTVGVHFLIFWYFPLHGYIFTYPHVGVQNPRINILNLALNSLKITNFAHLMSVSGRHSKSIL